MPCCHPVQAFWTGCLTDNDKKDFIRCPDNSYAGYLPLTKIKKKVDFSHAPIAVIPGEGRCLVEPMEQPCGACVGCRLDKARDWKVRCCLELQENPECYFVTLTYDDYHLRFHRSTGEPFPDYSDVQKFLKRLRKQIGPVRYYGCAEYGKEEFTKRPHFHVLLWCHIDKTSQVGVRKWTSEILAKCWPFGNHVIEDVMPGNIAYVCGYVEKKQADPDWDDYPVKPYTFMSLKPAIGAMYFIRNYDSIKATKKVYGLFDDSGKCSSAPLPRYFKRLLEDVAWYESWKEEQLKAADKRLELERAVYKIKSRSQIGEAKEMAYYFRLEDKRRKTL